MGKKALNVKSSEAWENYYEKLRNNRGAYKLQIAKVKWIIQGGRGNYPWDQNRSSLSLLENCYVGERRWIRCGRTCKILFIQHIQSILFVNYPHQTPRFSSSAKYGLSIAFLLFSVFRLIHRPSNTIALNILVFEKQKSLCRGTCATAVK